MSPVREANFLERKILGFRSTAAIKQQRRLKNVTNLTIVCSCRSFCIDLPVALVDCQAEGCPSRLHHVCQGGYVVLHDIDFEGAERKICHHFFDDLRVWVNSEAFNNLLYSTLYGMDVTEEDEEEVEGTVPGGNGDEVSIMPAVCPHGTVSVSSIGSFEYVGLSYKPSDPSLPLSLSEYTIFKSISRRRGGGEAKMHQATGGEGQA